MPWRCRATGYTPRLAVIPQTSFAGGGKSGSAEPPLLSDTSKPPAAARAPLLTDRGVLRFWRPAQSAHEGGVGVETVQLIVPGRAAVGDCAVIGCKEKQKRKRY